MMIHGNLRRASLPAGIALILSAPFAAFAQEADSEATTLDRIEIQRQRHRQLHRQHGQRRVRRRCLREPVRRWQRCPGGCRIPSFYTVDLSGRWKPTDSLEIFASVLNATDKIAPLDPLTYGAVNYNPMHSSGAIGRYFTLGAKYTFN